MLIYSGHQVEANSVFKVAAGLMRLVHRAWEDKVERTRAPAIVAGRRPAESMKTRSSDWHRQGTRAPTAAVHWNLVWTQRLLVG